MTKTIYIIKYVAYGTNITCVYTTAYDNKKDASRNASILKACGHTNLEVLPIWLNERK